MELDESALQSLIEDYGNVVYSVSYDGGSPGHTGSARVLHCLESYWSCDDNGNFGGPYNDIDEALFDCHIRFGEVDLDVSSSELSSQQIASRLELDCPTGHIVSINEEEWVMDKDGELNLCAEEKAEDEDDVVVYDPLNLSEKEEKERASYIAEVEKQCRVRAKELGLPGVEEHELAEDVRLEMVLIPAGKFMMGSPASEKDRYDWETQHEVTLTKPFYMGKYEVTQEQWEGVMGDNPSEEKGAKLPVTDVSWNDCKEFIKKLNGITKGKYRLPREAEWEYACRAGTSTAYSFGDEITPKDANCLESKIVEPVAVGSYKPNAFGLYDMHGNVFEWCEDWYGDYPTGAVTDPKGPAKGEYRVLRGGSFGNCDSVARSSFRDYEVTPSDRDFNVGFRLARTADIKTVTAPAAAPKPDPAKLKQEKEAKAKQMELVKSAIEKEMVCIPAGTFMMGSPESEEGRQDVETQHEVTLTNPYYMGKYEVTQEQYEAVMGKNPSDTKGAKFPVTNVSWGLCQAFITKLNAKTGGGYRLPTEAEWEYACRAGTTTAYSYGNSLTKADANIDGNSTKEVGSYKPNVFGLYDMHGNVWEWCEDWYGEYPSAVTDPKGPATGERRVLRGGSFLIYELDARSSGRGRLSPTNRDFGNGFRLARTP